MLANFTIGMIRKEAGHVLKRVVSAENQSAEIYPQAYKEEVFFIVSLKTLFENLNVVKKLS